MGKRNLTFELITMPPKKSSVVNTSGWDPRPWTRPGLGEEQVMEIKDAFDLFDKDRSGEITVGEMLEAMRSLGYDTDAGEAAEHVKSLDRDGSGSVSVQNMRAIADQVGDQVTDDELGDIILKNDMDNDGQLTFEDFYAVLTKKSFD